MMRTKKCWWLLLSIAGRYGYALPLLDAKNRGSVSRRACLATVPAVGSLLGKSFCAVAADQSNLASAKVYAVVPDASEALNPNIKPISYRRLIKKLAVSKGGALWLGEHHNAAKDHNLQVSILRELVSRRGRTKTAVGLEQVQQKFQPVLDDFGAGLLSSQQLREQVEWDRRWMWPFDVYEPVFEAARELNVPLIALNVDSEDLALVERGGLPGMPPDILKRYIKDRVGFAEFAKPRAFAAYVDYAIRPSYDMHQAMGLLSYTMSGEKLDQEMPFRNFFSSRILWDEVMASTAYAWTKSHPGSLLVGLVGADHVKFYDGIPGRYARLARDQQESISILLNPTLIDTRPSGSVGMEGANSTRPDTITLQLRYLKDGVDVDSPERTLPSSTGGVLPLADYLIIG